MLTKQWIWKSDWKFTKNHLRNTFTSNKDESRIGENINRKQNALSRSKYRKRGYSQIMFFTSVFELSSNPARPKTPQ